MHYSIDCDMVKQERSCADSNGPQGHPSHINRRSSSSRWIRGVGILLPSELVTFAKRSDRNTGIASTFLELACIEGLVVCLAGVHVDQIHVCCPVAEDAFVESVSLGAVAAAYNLGLVVRRDRNSSVKSKRHRSQADWQKEERLHPG